MHAQQRQDNLEQSVEEVAEPAGITLIEDFQCRDLLLQSGDDRDRSLAFLTGYMLGAISSNTIDGELLAISGEATLEACVDNADTSALEIMREVYASLTAEE